MIDFIHIQVLFSGAGLILISTNSSLCYLNNMPVKYLHCRINSSLCDHVVFLTNIHPLVTDQLRSPAVMWFSVSFISPPPFFFFLVQVQLP